MKKQYMNRKNTLLHFGFGTEALKSTTVCKNCSSLQPSGKMFCSNCNAKLPKENLYDLYKTYHERCTKCGNVLSEWMKYCPRCGIKLNY